MKTITYLVSASTLLLAFVACNCKKKATTSSVSAVTSSEPSATAKTSAINTTNTSSAASGKSEEQYRFVVSFYSIGQGIDVKTHDEFVKFMDSYLKKITYEPIHWGREGETDYCLSLSELSASEQAEFVKKAKEILAKSTLIHIKENALCENKGKWPGIQTIAESGNDTYRLVVSFYSTGEGIDVKTHDEFVKFMDSYLKKITYEPTHWGREGEVDYCLSLNELSPNEQLGFIKKAKEILGKSTRVHINENAKCVNKR